MKVTYTGNVSPMISYGYDFTNGPVDIPETDKFAIRKYIGNGHFRCDHVDSFEFKAENEQEQKTIKHDAPVQMSTSVQTISIGVFKKQQDGKPYSRPEKVFRGEVETGLKIQAMEWMAEKEINPDERIIMVK